MHPQRVESLSHAQRERLAYIDFRLYFMGEIGRPDLASRFGVAPAGATRDLALYREIAPQNIEFDGSNKIYRIGQAFSPLFDHASQRVLSALALGFGDGVNGATQPLLPCESPTALSNPRMDVLAPVCRAIHAKRPVAIRYHSMSSGVARARSAAKGTVFAALLGKQLLETVSDRQNYDGNRVGVAVASSSAITPIAWEFETVGLCKGWDKTDTLLLPSSIPSAITTQTSAVFDTHAAAIAFQDGIFGVCAAIEYAHLSFTHQRSDYFLIIGAEEVCQIQCSALAALGDRRPWIDSASGLVLSGSPNSAGDWQLALCGNAVEGAAQVLPEEWADASMIQIDIESSATLFSAPLVSYALHHLFVNATGKAVLSCRLPGRGKYVLGFTQHASC